MISSEIVHSSCLCRSVRWEVRAPLFKMSHCHCRMCRKAHGAPFATYVNANADRFRYEQGAELIALYRSSAAILRGFCGRCGSVVPDPPSEQSVSIPAGCLDQDPGVRPSLHIFVASKAPWYEIADSLPQYAEYPPDGGMSAVAPTLAAGGAARGAQPAGEPSVDGAARGSCLCGRVAYEVGPGAWSLFYCHGSRCRKARASAHSANAFVERARFAWLRGETELRSYKIPEAARFAQAFCATCGSPMPAVRAERVVVPVASLDTAIARADARHIYVASRAPSFEIADSLPQHAALPT